VDGGDGTGSHGATTSNEKGISGCVSTGMSVRRKKEPERYTTGRMLDDNRTSVLRRRVELWQD
jgi:hypothetical protein